MKKPLINTLFLALTLLPTALSSWAQGLAQAAPQTAAQLISATTNDKNLNFATSKNHYKEAIEQLEDEAGAFDGELPQMLMGLGQNYQHQGNHKQAIDTFKRAIHVNRINEGLYNLSQVPLVESLIESHVASGQWDEANDQHQYLYWLHSRNYEPNDPRILPTIDKLSDWHLNAYAMGVGGSLFKHLISAHELYKLAVSIISENYGEDDLRKVEALRGLSVSNYYLATYQGERTKGFQVNSKFESAFDRNSVSDQQRVRLDQYIVNSYRSGKTAITKMVDIYQKNPEAPAADAVKAQIELGDWYQLFGKWNSAQQVYQDAYNELWNNEATRDEAGKLFGHPKALPVLPLVDSEITQAKGESPDYVLVSFDVSEYGRARNIAIIESQPEGKVSIRTRVRRSLKNAKFRPRFENGIAVTTEHMKRRFIFPSRD